MAEPEIRPFDPEEFENAIEPERGNTESFAQNAAEFREAIEKASDAADKNPETMEAEINEAILKGDNSGLEGPEREIFEKKRSQNKRVADSLNSIAESLKQADVKFDADGPFEKNFDESKTGKANTEFMKKLFETFADKSGDIEGKIKAEVDDPKTNASKKAWLKSALKFLSVLGGVAKLAAAAWFGGKVLRKMASDASTCVATNSTDVMNVRLDCPNDLKENSDGSLKKDFIDACNCPSGGGFPNEITKFCPSADESMTCPKWDYNFDQVSPWDILSQVVTTFVDAAAGGLSFTEKLLKFLKKYWWAALILVLLPLLIRLISAGRRQI